MKKAILATKIGMTQIFNADGVLVPVTVLEAGPCVVTQIKTVENDGYSAVQVGFGDKKEKVVEKDANGKKSVAHRHGVNKAQMGHFKKAGVSGKRFVREFKFENADEYNLADEIKADIFAEGDKVDVTAISKGKGFQGAIKRLGQHRGPMAHGSKFHRHQGSNGACDSYHVTYKCDCGLERVEKMIRSLGKKEVERMRDEDPVAEVNCQFCNKNYKVDLNELLKNWPSTAENVPSENA
mgnify:CR=1 FL=1